MKFETFSFRKFIRLDSNRKHEHENIQKPVGNSQKSAESVLNLGCI
jgi:hypothetical protein